MAEPVYPLPEWAQACIIKSEASKLRSGGQRNKGGQELSREFKSMLKDGSAASLHHQNCLLTNKPYNLKDDKLYTQLQTYVKNTGLMGGEHNNSTAGWVNFKDHVAVKSANLAQQWLADPSSQAAQAASNATAVAQTAPQGVVLPTAPPGGVLVTPVLVTAHAPMGFTKPPFWLELADCGAAGTGVKSLQLHELTASPIWQSSPLLTRHWTPRRQCQRN